MQNWQEKALRSQVSSSWTAERSLANRTLNGNCGCAVRSAGPGGTPSAVDRRAWGSTRLNASRIGEHQPGGHQEPIRPSDQDRPRDVPADHLRWHASPGRSPALSLPGFAGTSRAYIVGERHDARHERAFRGLVRRSQANPGRRWTRDLTEATIWPDPFCGPTTCGSLFAIAEVVH
jgi:hypothetical protein